MQGVSAPFFNGFGETLLAGPPGQEWVGSPILFYRQN